MFSAHVIFIDIRGHSSLPFLDRVPILEQFWTLAEEHQPAGLADTRNSFYKTDNDNLLAGFSDCPGLQSGIDVLSWFLELRQELRRTGIDVSAGANLCAVKHSIEWKVDAGLIDDAMRLYIPDDVIAAEGMTTQRIVGDIIIAAKRCLEISQVNSIPLVFSTLQGGHLGQLEYDSKMIRTNWNVRYSRVTDAELQEINRAHSEWLFTRQIKPYALRIHDS
jgi:hypothetical protein